MSDPTEPRYQWNAARRRTLDLFNELLMIPPEHLVKNCLNCDHFDEAGELCKQFGQRPPARIIAHSCERWENIEDEIPF